MFSQLSSRVYTSWISACGILRNTETVLVTLDPSSRWAVTMVPFLFVIASGVGLSGVDNLFSRGCFTRTVSPSSVGFASACRRLSA